MARKKKTDDDPPQASRDELLWLETYFIVFPQQRRPTLTQVERALSQADQRLKLENLAADEEGYFQSVLVQSAEDHAAVEISYETGDAVVQQNMQWAKEMREQLDGKQLQQIVAADARIVLAHFERIRHGAGSKPPSAAPRPKPRRDHERDFVDAMEDELSDEYSDSESFLEDEYDEEAAMEIFDPSCLLTVVEALSGLTKGLTFDPASGEVM